MRPKLSICIPSYNRADLLNDTLDCISSQLRPEVEIFVSDNASTDNTSEMLRSWEQKLPNFRWHRLPENVGYDRNFINLINGATGDYCWILSSDDLVEPGTIDAILSGLSSHSSLSGVTLNGKGFSRDMNVQIQETTFSNHKNLNRDTLFEDGELAYSEIGEYFGFVSAQVINRELALKVIKDDLIYDYLNLYIHVYVIGRILQIAPRWLYLDQPLIQWRSGNDSIHELGRIRRLAVDVNGFEKISRDVWGISSKPYRTVQERVCRMFVCASLLESKVNKQSSLKYMMAIIKLCAPVYWRYPVFWYRVLPFILLPGWFLIRLKSLKNIRS